MSTDKRLKRILVTVKAMELTPPDLRWPLRSLSCSLKRCGYQRRWWTALDAQEVCRCQRRCLSMNEGIVASR